MSNRLIPAKDVAKEFIDAIDDATKDMSAEDQRKFNKEVCEWLYRFNGFPAEGPKDN